MRILAIETATEACSAALYLDGVVEERFQVAPRRHTHLILPMAEALLAEAGLTLSALDGLAFGRGPGSFTGLRIAAGVIQGLAFGADLPVVPVSTLAALAWQVFDEGAADCALAALDARMGEVYWGIYRAWWDACGRMDSGDADNLAGQPGWTHFSAQMCEARKAKHQNPSVGASSPHPCGEDPGTHPPARFESLFAETVISPEAVPVELPGSASAIGIGPGWEVYGEILTRRVGEERLVRVWPDRLPRAEAVARLAVEALASGQGVAPEQALPVYLRDRVAKAAQTGRTTG
ncbi:MAG: hypothetical protein Kow0060_03270 [Methylohalobius crimeensis]